MNIQKTIQKNLSRLVLVLVSAALLSSCGFHLREAFELPLEYTPVAIQVPREYREFTVILDQEMRRAGIPLSDKAQDASLLVRLKRVSEVDELLTASATGSPLERKLILKATVDWEDSEGLDVIASETFTIIRTFVYDDTAVLAKRREAESLTRELERELAHRIILRLRQLAK